MKYKAYEIILDGDNLIGLAFTTNEKKALEIGIENSLGNEKNLKVYAAPHYGEGKSEHFVSKEMMRHFYNYKGW